jgi:hypothetical protein
MIMSDAQAAAHVREIESFVMAAGGTLTNVEALKKISAVIHDVHYYLASKGHLGPPHEWNCCKHQHGWAVRRG